ncbi:MAG: PilZ domain-containing protein, partial [Nitrospirota bacterium]
SVVQPFTGMQVELLIELPGEPTPIHISRGAVRWSGSQGIGVEFLTVAPTEQERIKRVVEQLSVTAGQALIIPKGELPKT